MKMRDDRPYLVQGRDIDTDFQVRFLPSFILPALVAPETADDVLGDKPALLRVRQDRAQIADYADHHIGGAAFLAQSIHERADERHG